MPSKAIRIDLEVITELDKLRPLSPSSYSSIILNLLRSHQELARIEQLAMSGVNVSKFIEKLSDKKKSDKNKNKTIKTPNKQIILFCYDCQTQTPQFQLKTKEWKCAICGSKRNV